MSFKNVIRVLMRPGCWIRSYDTDKRLDKFFWELIARKDEVEVLSFPDFFNGDFGYASLKLGSVTYRIWINDWHASLGSIKWCDPDSTTPRGTYVGRVPSRIVVIDFIEAFAPAPDNKRNTEEDDQLRALFGTLRPEEAQHGNP